MAFNFTKFSSSTVLSSTTLNSNFSAIEAQLGAIRNNEISPSAGLTSDKFADKYSVSYVTFVLYPTTWGAANGVKFQDTSTRGGGTNARFYPEFNGKNCYLVGIKGYVTTYNASATGDNGTIWVNINGYQLSPINISASGTFTVGGDFDDPLMPAAPGDPIVFAFGKQADTGANNPDARAITVTVAYKMEISK